jgi:predicted ArsR family transcriptional regulator
MPNRERQEVTDPRALRALAHPLRWKLMDILSREGATTATQCAEEVGESVANCSYHLNTLAKYGFVVPAEGGQGREKPWRVADRGPSWGDIGLDSEGALAAQAATTAFLDFEFNLIRERFLASHLEPEEWREAVGANNTNVYLTAAELAEVREQIIEMMSRFEDRKHDPAARPAGSRSVNLFLATSVAPRIKPE